jgi:GntR family transcriptional regulator, transcriptional repressor for pyruvate dehydrogenase complex
VSVEFAQIQIEPAYRKVAAAIGERILGRRLREGERLPSETELARQFGVNRSTVREALRELESRGLVQRRAGSKLMSVSRPQHASVAEGISQALLLHDVTVHDVWEALTILEPPIAVAAARARTDEDLGALTRAAAALSSEGADTGAAVQRTAEVFRCIGRATHNPVLGLAQEPLLQLLEPSLVIMIDKVPQARSRIVSAQQHLVRALEARDLKEAETWMARHIRDFKKGYELAGIDLTLRLHPQAGAGI